jgi:hypothetical protein
LGGILLLIQVDSQEHVVLLKVEGRCLAGAQELRYVLHLDEGHGRLLEFDARGSDDEVD